MVGISEGGGGYHPINPPWIRPWVVFPLMTPRVFSDLQPHPSWPFAPWREGTFVWRCLSVIRKTPQDKERCHVHIFWTSVVKITQGVNSAIDANINMLWFNWRKRGWLILMSFLIKMRARDVAVKNNLAGPKSTCLIIIRLSLFTFN